MAVAALTTGRPARIPPRTRAALDALYARYNGPAWIAPDPLAPVLRFRAPGDQEVAGLVAAALAFGNVKTILRAIHRVLEVLPRPRHDLLTLPQETIARRLGDFRHRYAGATEMLDLLQGMRRTIERHGSLEACFITAQPADAATALPGLAGFVASLRAESRLPRNYLLPDPARGSACKRLLMYLRWMIRRDAVDPGPWRSLSPALLVYPMDTHMHRAAAALGLTRRAAPDMRAALETTAAFRRIAPLDPVRYDFALTRLGIRRDSGETLDGFIAALRRRP